MTVTPIADALKMEHDQQVMAISGVVDSIFEWNEGQNTHGNWSLQNMFLKDGAGNKIKVKIKDRGALSTSLKGKKIYISCTNKNKKGWTGAKMKNDEYPKGKFSMVLYVTPSAEISLPDTGEILSEGGDEKGGEQEAPPPQRQQQPANGKRPAQQPAQRPAPQQQQPAQQPKKTSAPVQTKPPLVTPEEQAQHDANQEPNAPGDEQQQEMTPEEIESNRVATIEAEKAAKEKANHLAVYNLRKGLRKYCNAYWLCMQASDHIAAKYQEANDEPITAEHYQAMVATFWIQANRDGLVQEMPSGDITKYLPVKPEPVQPPEENPKSPAQ